MQDWGYRLFLTAIFGFLVSSAYLATQNNWKFSQLLLVPVFLIEICLGLLLTSDTQTSYETYLLGLSAIFLFGKRKVASARIFIVALYFVIGLSKLNESWLAAGVFSTFKIGLPLLPIELIPAACFLVIFSELCLCWWLLSRRRGPQSIALSVFFIFHIYSFAIIGAGFMLYALAPLFALFYRARNHSLRPSGLTIFLISAVLVANVYPLFLPGDRRETGQGTSLAFTLFDATRKARSNAVEIDKSGAAHPSPLSASSLDYFRVYKAFAALKRRCENQDLARISWDVDLALNGQPSKRLIESENVCALNFKAWQNNDWIRTGAPAEGRIFDVTTRTSFSSWAQEHLTLLSTIFIALSLVSFLTFAAFNQSSGPRENSV